ncbi:hypothetical protein [Sphaerimonospora mesophila]|uniref:hypothetical protein n=1 Tax=Sphaerimonospora mesophila TaxID=37483 RepID=UPI0006E12766
MNPWTLTPVSDDMGGIRIMAALVMLAACGAASTADPLPIRYQADGLVLAGAEHGPQLCAGVNLSMPPQCSGLDIAGWDWDMVEHEALRGVRWGDYHVVGTWDGERLTLTESPRPAERGEPPADGSDFTSPCPTPAGGWHPVDPVKATDQAIDAAIDLAEKLPGYAGSWLDQGYLDEIEGYDPRDPMEGYANDPKRLVLNLRFTGDPAVHERAIREVWGGALCLSPAQHTRAKLHAIQRRMEKEIKGLYSLSTDELAGHVDAGVWVVTPELRRQVDETYGAGLVVLHGFLKPISP